MKILLVDDDVSSVNALANLLEHEHTLRIATNGRDALDVVQVADIDAVITDINMPNMNGIDLLKAIRELGMNFPVVIVTGYPNEEYKQAAQIHGVRAFFSKPINVEQFMNTLKQIESENVIENND